MLLIILGVVVVAVGFVWMFACASAGWSDAWWYFDWQQFKFVLGAHLLAGGVLVGLGLKRLLGRRASRTAG